MKPDIVEKLLAVNRQFYQEFADQFDATRQRIQPGVGKILDRVSLDGKILDVGCGNGSVWRELLQRGFHGDYIGIDASPDLIVSAQRDAESRENGVFLQRDLADPDWSRGLPMGFDFIFGFAVFHHMPGHALRVRILQEIHKLLSANGRLALSNWQFMNSPRWVKRIQPWAQVGLDGREVDPGDTLLDWRRGGVGYRYVHHFTPEALELLAAASHFQVANTRFSDGKEGNLAIYQIWTKQ